MTQSVIKHVPNFALVAPAGMVNFRRSRMLSREHMRRRSFIALLGNTIVTLLQQRADEVTE
jgi:hypothetical protein